jgi:hypothetical protein
VAAFLRLGEYTLSHRQRPTSMIGELFEASIPSQGAFQAPPTPCTRSGPNTLPASPNPPQPKALLPSRGCSERHSPLVIPPRTIHNEHNGARVGCYFSISPIPVSSHRSAVQFNSTFCVGSAPQKLLIVSHQELQWPARYKNEFMQRLQQPC